MKNQVTILIKYIALRKRLMNSPYKYTEHQVFDTVCELLHMDSELLAFLSELYKNSVTFNTK